MSGEAITITISGNIKADIAARIRDIGVEALKADSSLETLRSTLNSFSAAAAIKAAGSDVRELRNEINRATQTQKTFAAQNSTTAKSLLDGAQAADKYGASLKRIDGANVTLGKSTSNLKNLVGSLAGLFGGIFAIKGYAQAQDALTNLQNKIRSVSSSLVEQKQIQEQLFAVANRTRSDVTATADGFVRFKKAMDGASNSEVLRFVETLNKSLLTAGRSTAEVSSVVIQLGQALTSGRLQGDEFRSLSENLPREALTAIAKQLNTTVDNLKQLSSEGKITTEVLRAAFAELANTVDTGFAQTIPTIGQALTVLNNQFIAFTESTSGAAGLVSSAIMLIADNLNIVIPIVAAFAAIWLTVTAITIITEMVAGLTMLVAAMTAVSIITVAWVAIIALVVAGIAALVYLIRVAGGETRTFAEFIGDSVSQIKEFAASLMGMGTANNDAATGTAVLSKAVKQSSAVMADAASNAKDASSSIKSLGDNAGAAADQTVAATRKITSGFKEMTAAAKAAASAAYSALQSAGGSSGSFTAVSSPSKDSKGNTSSVTIQGQDGKFATGGSIMVGGKSGTDKNLVQFRASRGERVDISTPAQQRAAKRGGSQDNTAQGNTFNFNVVTPDANSFRRSRGQLAREMSSVLGG